MVSPSTRAEIPSPGKVRYSSTLSEICTLEASRATRTAFEIGWDDCDSALASQYMSVSCFVPGAMATLTILYSPIVSVPVLSKHKAFKRLRFSKNCPPLIRTPLLAAAERPLTIVAGVERTRAHGQDVTRNTQAL